MSIYRQLPDGDCDYDGEDQSEEEQMQIEKEDMYYQWIQDSYTW